MIEGRSQRTAAGGRFQESPERPGMLIPIIGIDSRSAIKGPAGSPMEIGVFRSELYPGQ